MFEGALFAEEYGVLDFSDQFIKVTGGMSGISWSIAWKLAEDGAAVAIADRHGNAADETAREIASAGCVA